MPDPVTPAPRELPRQLSWLAKHRAIFTTVANLAVAGLAYALAFLLRFDFVIPEYHQYVLLVTLPAAVAIHFAAFYVFKLTRGWWRYVGITDFLNALKAAGVGALGLGTFVVLFYRNAFYPRAVLLLNVLLVVGLTIGLRLIVRLWRQVPGAAEGPRRRLLLVGAGDTGEALLREIRQSARLPYHVVAFVDDDPQKRGAYINGVPVFGKTEDIETVTRTHEIDEIIVATPSASGEEMRAIIQHCRATGKPFKVMPATWELLDGNVSLGAAREVDINDLLRRPPVELDLAAIGRFLRGKRVVVTGAAGSIGSEICRQVLRHEPHKLVCIDHDENALFYLDRALSPLRERADVQMKLGDITDEGFVDSVFARVKPEVVFHAAAHKHVPMIEANPLEGVRNNVFGTEVVATLAGRHSAEAFVLISTDKAVNPSSIMGATKRIAELLIRSLPFRTRYTAVRFGNVLGSQGSVVPILKEQVAAGGPVTITHPDMERYFMTIPEAVELVIQASAMGQENQVYMLDMGAPVRILDLAHDLITLSGLRPGVDIEIVFTGIRPGEKLREELTLSEEAETRTTHPKILEARATKHDPKAFGTKLAELRAAVTRHDEPETRRLVSDLVPEYLTTRTPTNVVPITSARQTGPKPTRH
jgi:FlaA1/EpsC-like NDP-sugar epimerase